MPDTIRDGAGSGRLAKVDAENRILVGAVSEPQAAHISETNNDYYLACNGPGHSTTQSGWRLHLKNNDADKYLHVQEIQVTVDGAGRWHMGHSGVPSSGTDIVPTNLFIGALRQADVECKYADDMSFTTNPSKFTGGRMAADTKYIEKFDGAMILDTGQSVQLHWSGDAAGTNIAFAIQFYMLEKEAA